MYVWTLPQGGTTVSLPNILNSPPSQDKNSEVQVSLDFLMQLDCLEDYCYLFILHVIIESIHIYKIKM